MASVKINFKLLFIPLILSVEYSGSEFSSFKKCCNDDQILDLRDGLYSCQSAPRHAPEFYERISTGRGSSIPVCKNSSNLGTISIGDIDTVDFLQDNSCADVLLDFNKFEDLDKGREPLLPTVVLFCSDSNETLSHQHRDVPTIFNVRRCCPKGEIFDVNNRACSSIGNNERDVSTASLLRNIGSFDFIHVIRGPPKCQHAVVDYEVNTTDVSYVDGRLQVTASSSYDVVGLLTTEESACLDVGSSPGLVVVRACRGVEFCRGNSCLRKCCPEDEALSNGTCQKQPSHLTMSKWHQEVWDLPKIVENSTDKILNSTEYGLIIGKPCLYGMYPVFKHEGWHIFTNGMVHVPGYVTYEHHQYCIDMLYNFTHVPDGFYLCVCYDDPAPERNSAKTRFAVNAALLSVSCAFLFITLFVYICLPALQNLHGKTLMCHVASLLMAFVCLVMVAVATPKKYENEIKDYASASICKFLGYAMLFFFLSAFFWLNVMCFDIWWKFGSMRHSGRTNTKRRDDFKRFLIYCFYAWGLAMLLTILAVIVDFFEFLPSYLQPGIGVEKCWFEAKSGVYGEVLFFTGPVSIQLLVNLVFFIMTARRCSLVKAEIQKRVMLDRSNPRRRRFEADKSKFILNVKLFVVMGVTWLMEILSFFFNNYASDFKWKTEFFYASDVVNCLQGFLIFVLFVLKKKVFYALRRRFSKDGQRRAGNGAAGILDPYRVRKSPSSSTILSTFAVSSSP